MSDQPEEALQDNMLPLELVEALTFVWVGRKHRISRRWVRPETTPMYQRLIELGYVREVDDDGDVYYELVQPLPEQVQLQIDGPPTMRPAEVRAGIHSAIDHYAVEWLSKLCQEAHLALSANVVVDEVTARDSINAGIAMIGDNVPVGRTIRIELLHAHRVTEDDFKGTM